VAPDPPLDRPGRGGPSSFQVPYAYVAYKKLTTLHLTPHPHHTISDCNRKKGGPMKTDYWKKRPRGIALTCEKCGGKNPTPHNFAWCRDCRRKAEIESGVRILSLSELLDRQKAG
jgi:ribosomal protein S14